MKVFIKLIICFSVLLNFSAMASSSLSYSGRLVQNSGAPVTGPVNLRAELVYTNATSAILCSQVINNVSLTKGVFHLKLDFDCTPKTITQILSETPNNESVAIRIVDLINSKTYPFQAIHSVPFSIIAGQLPQMGASTGQALGWDGAKWSPLAVGSGNGTVTNILTGTGLTGGPISTTGTISLANSGVGTSQIADNAITAAKINAGEITSSHISATANIPYSKLSIGAGEIPQDRINGLSGSMSALIEDVITDAVTGKAPSQNAVYDALGLKADRANVAQNITTASVVGLVAPTVGSAAANRDYVDNSSTTLDTRITNEVATLNTTLGNKYDKAGGVISGDVTLNTQLLLKGGANFVTVKASPGTANYVVTLPTSAGISGYVLQTDGAGVLSWVNPGSVATGLGTVNSASITDGSIVDADIDLSANINQSKIAGLATSLSAKENTIVAGLISQYYRGDKVWSSLQNDVQSLIINNYAVGTNTALLNTDSLIGSLGKLQGQINSRQTSVLASGNILVGNASNVASAVIPSSDVSMTNDGVFTVTKLQGKSVSTTAPVLGSFLKWDNILSQWAPTPLATCAGTSQVMHYILLTDTWSCDTLNIDNILPAQAANSGKVLTTNGTTASWQPPAGVIGLGTTNYLPKFTATSTLGDSLIFDNGTKVGVGTNTPVNTLSVLAPYSSASSSGSAANGGFRLMNTTDAVVLDMGIGINTTAWLQARDPANYATKKDLLLNPVGGNVTVGGKNTFVSLSTNSFAAANGVMGVVGNDPTSASSYGIMVLANNKTTPAVGDIAGELRLSMNNNSGWRDMAFITAKAEGAGGANGFGGNLIFSLKTDNANSAPSERMRITSSGKVGIGDTAPEGKFSVRGLAWGNYSSSSATYYYPFNSAGSQGNAFAEISNSNSGYGAPGSFLGLKTNAMSSTPDQRAYIGVVANMGAANYTPHIIIGHQTGATAYQERVRIDTSGRVGIGTTTPNAQLDVNGVASMNASTETISTYVNTSVAYTIPDTLTNIRRLTLSGNATITLPSFTSATPKVFTLTVFLKQDASGNRTMNFIGDGTDTIKWDSGLAPTIATSATKITILQFTKPSDETVWYASKVWQE